MFDNVLSSRSAAAVKAMAAGSWVHILAGLAPTLLPALQRPGKHVPCPLHGGVDGFRVFSDVAASGGGVCNTCGAFPDGLALLMWANDWSFAETLQAVRAELGLALTWSSPTPPSQTQPTDAGKGRRAQLQGLWQEGLPLDDPAAGPARRYLHFRVPGLQFEAWPRVLRFHPALAYHDDRRKFQGRYPALLARLQGPDGRGVSIHRTYLTSEGRKAALESPKKLMAPYQPGATLGASIRLFEASSTLAITEGLETALAVHVATYLPVWAAVSANGLARAILPDAIRTVFICADNDANNVGQNAAYTLGDRLAREGRAVKVLIPPHCDTDWSDHVAGNVPHQ